ncbi:MAG: DUF1232 domain-containing protein [bacterium]|nr:DUF1232 domain-containing protein [bacterium]
MSETRLEIDLRARERRFYDRLRALVVRPVPGEGTGVRDLLLLLPDMFILLVRLARDDRVPMGSKMIAVLGVAYVLSPIELMPEIILGPIGLIDDLVVVAAALSRVINRVHPDIVNSHWSGQGDALEAIRKVTAWSEKTLGKVVTGVLGFTRVRARN